MARVTAITDSPEFLDLMREILTGEGHQMEGLDAAGISVQGMVETDPRLLIVDVRLEGRPPGISGWELIVLARSQRELLDVPIILCTSDRWEIEMRAEDLAQIAGVHVLTKPFKVDDLIGLIDGLLAEAPAYSGTP